MEAFEERVKFVDAIKLTSASLFKIALDQSCAGSNVTAPFNNMRTPTFKAQPTNAFFATVNQVFGDSSQPPTTVERAV